MEVHAFFSALLAATALPANFCSVDLINELAVGAHILCSAASLPIPLSPAFAAPSRSDRKACDSGASDKMLDGKTVKNFNNKESVSIWFLTHFPVEMNGAFSHF